MSLSFLSCLITGNVTISDSSILIKLLLVYLAVTLFPYEIANLDILSKINSNKDFSISK